MLTITQLGKYKITFYSSSAAFPFETTVLSSVTVDMLGDLMVENSVSVNNLKKKDVKDF